MRMIFHRFVAYVGSTFIALLLLGSVSATDSGDAERLIVGNVSSFTNEINEAVLIAESLGITQKEAEERFAGQEEFLQAIEFAYEKERKSFFASEWSPDQLDKKGYKAWVSFTGKIDSSVIDRFSELPIPVQIRFDAPASEKEVEVVREKAIRFLDSTGEYETLGGSIDPHSGTVEIVGNPISNEIDQPNESLLAYISDLADKSPVDITLAHDNTLSVDPEIVRGGVEAGTCTLGFTARYGSTSAVFSAEHCPNYPGIPELSTVPLGFISEHKGSYGEPQLHSTTDTITNSFRKGPGATYQAVTARAWPSNGAAICNSGKTRWNSSCTTVRNWNYAFTYNGTYYARMAQSNGTFTNSGDSGGPWYYNSNAIGLHFGKFGGYSTFSRVIDAEAILSATVLTY